MPSPRQVLKANAHFCRGPIKHSSMKVLCVSDLYFERVAVIGYVAWGRAGAPARPHLSVANIGKGQFPRDHRQRNSNERQCHFRPQIDRHFILSV
jgi:hypothetical protein